MVKDFTKQAKRNMIQEDDDQKDDEDYSEKSGGIMLILVLYTLIYEICKGCEGLNITKVSLLN